jgi:hypothetical protein
MAIKKVGNLQVGQKVVHEGVECIIESFPTRNSVVLKAIHPKSGQFSSAKISIKDLLEGSDVK